MFIYSTIKNIVLFSQELAFIKRLIFKIEFFLLKPNDLQQLLILFECNVDCTHPQGKILIFLLNNMITKVVSLTFEWQKQKKLSINFHHK